jgi:hypothetical protein
MNKTFRGRLANATENKIRLSTNNGLIGYKIRKFELMQTTPSEQPENTIKVNTYSTPVADIDENVNFEDPRLLAVGMIWGSTNQIYPHETHVIFDDKIINQDIYITNFQDPSSAGGAPAINYYLELEKVKLDLNEATVATLKDMRGRE